MVLTGLKSPLFEVLTRAAPAGSLIVPATPSLDQVVLDHDFIYEPLIFVCANYKEAVALFETIAPEQFFSNFHGKKSIIFADASKPFWQSFAKYLIPYVDAYATADCVVTPLSKSKWIPNVYMPIPRTEWAEPGSLKPVDFAFYGSVSMFRERVETLALLCQQGINIKIAGGIERGYSLDFLAAMRKTKITLNFSNCNTGPGAPIHHLKGRIWEAAVSRTVVVETRNPVTPLLFSDAEVVWYDHKEELPNILIDLLSDPIRLEKISERFFHKAIQFLDPANFWKSLE